MLRRAEQRAPLLAELACVERLVLLGDVVELRHGPVRSALAAAEQALGGLAGALKPGGEVIVVPGNHDHHLLGGWLERRARKGAPPPLGLETAVDWRAGEPLAAVARALQSATVRAAYPGVWLRDDIYATHGHYLDRHTTVPMLERLGAGVMARIAAEPPAGPQLAEDYERVLAPIYAWIHSVAQTGGPELGRSSHGANVQAWRALSRRRRGAGVRRRAMIAGFPLAVAALNRAGLGPLRADVSAPELRRAGLRAFAEVLARLGLQAGHVIFGHTHRAGPLPGDDEAEWSAPTAVPLLNTGCWVHEPAFLGRRPHESPYRPGFAAVLEDQGPPRLVNLLDRQPAPA